ncbi:cell division protein ZipA [Pseudoalteromonas luteoviolacea]|uniref:cell division protein ZipA n=1 Tax=Pseudoalteromonas luteoviolacea TaxID=43657 RepID=UPI001B3A020E|nr:cell division protein ZipA [Pseudoalteromonas luteoviolacea]MBQ4880345.1 cell division protein ZipA [Pseudoalteromonas luteoviolacea]MBQ4909428.1 cell division protein ZipA [Pseudoalteromonas luteoviolacea]
MATELRWALIVISALIIGGLLIHGLWSVRKKEDKNDRTQDLPAAKEDAKPKEPELSDMSFAAVDEEPQQPNTSHVQSAHDESQPAEQQDNAHSEQSAPEPQDFIILHIQMPEGLTMAGSKLLPSVLSLGFKYSEEGFFNRHLESSGNGPVLFRLVNMYNPGTFDIDNMEQFSTAGVSLFMTLPCEGDSMAAFNMLHGAAKKLSDEFGAQVLDSNREPLTVDTIRTYVEKVREFAA